MMTPTEILIILLNWNGWKDTKECLDSILKLENVEYSILVVDNGSKTDCIEIEEYGAKHFGAVTTYTKEQVRESVSLQHPVPNTLTLIKNNENLGFARGNNVGISYAAITGFEFVYLLNNDTVVEPQSLYKLIKTLDKSNYTAVVPQIRYYNPADVIWCCGGETRGFYEHYYYKNENISVVPNIKLIDITFATGCALLFKRSEVGQLSEKFFFGEEDFELSLRLKKNDKKMACVVDAIIYHKESASIDKSAKFLNKIYIHKLNRLINIKTYAPLTWPFIILYRAFKFFLLMLLVEKIGLKKSIKYGVKIACQAIRFDGVSKDLFFDILALDLS